MKQLLYSRLHRHILGGSEQRFRAYVASQPNHIVSAQKLHAEVYLKRGFIYEQDVAADGLISHSADPHRAKATYFVVTRTLDSGKEEVIAAARHIRAAQPGCKDLPLLQHSDINKEYRRHISSYQPSNCVEVSALVKKRGFGSLPTLLLYRVMWQHSLQQGDKLWLMACSPPLFKRLTQLFGATFFRIGPTAPYVGEEVIPVMLKIEEAERRLQRQARRSWHPGKRFLYRELLAFFTSDDHFLLKRHD